MSHDVSRRALLAAIAAAGGLGALPGSLRSALAQSAGEKLAGDGEVIVCTWGGNYSDKMQEIWFDPFGDATGIYASTTAIPDMAKLEVMDRVNNVEWDLIDTEGAQMIQAAEKGLLAPIDYDLVFSIVPKDQIEPNAIRPYGIGSVAFSTVIAWNTETVGAEGPQTWKEMFDTSKFTGRRALYAQPRPTFEIALLAAGVKPEDLYPMNIDEAFEACDAIRDKVDLWVERTSQWGVLMQSGEVDLVGASLSRMKDEKDAGRPTDFHFNESIVEQSYWTVPAKAPGREQAMKLIAWMMQPEGMRAYASAMPFTVANTTIYDEIPEGIAKTLPGYPANAARNVHIDEAWWGENAEAVQLRWLDWMSRA